jgi:hypothetical protein
MLLANSGSPGAVQPDHLTMLPEQMKREQAMADFKPLNIYGHRTYAMKPAAKITTMTGRISSMEATPTTDRRKMPRPEGHRGPGHHVVETRRGGFKNPQVREKNSCNGSGIGGSPIPSAVNNSAHATPR